jgi:hypothetical protein
MGDCAFRLLPYPRIPLYFIYWSKDAEFGARISVLFDRSIEASLTASGIWGLFRRVSIELLRGPAPSLSVIKTGQTLS